MIAASALFPAVRLKVRLAFSCAAAAGRQGGGDFLHLAFSDKVVPPFGDDQISFEIASIHLSVPRHLLIDRVLPVSSAPILGSVARVYLGLVPKSILFVCVQFSVFCVLP